MTPHIVIAGPMGVGKSTTALALGVALGRPVRDSDRDIEARFGATGADIAASRGVDELHRIEAEVLLAALASDEPTVISAAGWTIEHEPCRQALRHGAFVVMLRVDLDELVRRVAADTHRRPMSAHEMAVVAARRDPLYATITQLTLDARLSTSTLVRAIVDGLEGAIVAGNITSTIDDDDEER